jgi:cystathionine gamma-synthase
MKTGYPRFFVHKSIERLADDIVLRFGHTDEKAILFPTPAVANRCLDFFRAKAPELGSKEVRRLDLVPLVPNGDIQQVKQVLPGLFCVLFPKSASPIAKQVWQHTGDGVSSRRAEFCFKALEDGLIGEGPVNGSVPPSPRASKGPRRYQKQSSSNGIEVNDTGNKENEPQSSMTNSSVPTDGREYVQFIEERFGRNLDINLAANAKLAIRRRIAGSLVTDVGLDEAIESTVDNGSTRQMNGFSEEDVYLYPCGMSAIFNTHRTLMAVRGPLKSICFGYAFRPSERPGLSY